MLLPGIISREHKRHVIKIVQIPTLEHLALVVLDLHPRIVSHYYQVHSSPDQENSIRFATLKTLWNNPSMNYYLEQQGGHTLKYLRYTPDKTIFYENERLRGTQLLTALQETIVQN